MFCKNCGKEILEESQFCEFCGFNQIQNGNYKGAKKKKNISTIIGMSCSILIILMALLIIIAALQLDSGETKVGNETSISDVSSEEKNGEPDSEDKTVNKKLTIGDITHIDNFDCKIKEVNWYSAGDFDYDCVDHEEGFEYIVILLSETNTTDDTENAPMLSMLSADGKQCLNITALSLYKKKYKINFGATMPQSEAEAYVIYKIPEGSSSFELQFLSNGFGKSSDYIAFSRNDIKS